MSDTSAGPLEYFLENSVGKGTEKTNMRRKQIINSIKAEFLDWCSEGKVLVLGSYSLGIHLEDSDIDLLCIAPSRYPREEFQQDFYSRLENLNDISYCNGIFQAKVPIIKLVILGISVDIQYATTDDDLDSPAQVNTIDEASLLGLNAYKLSRYILSSLANESSFQTLCTAVKHWAKHRNIYSTTCGYLSGISWALLCAKICLIYPNLSSTDLLHKFFKVFSRWDWSIPVSLNPSFALSEFTSPYMSILTPISPCYNTAYTLTASGFSMILAELELGAKIMNDIRDGMQDWTALYEKFDFFQQFRFFIKIEIMACGSSDFETWSGLIFSRVKYFLIDLERCYPRPVVCFYNKGYGFQNKQYKNCKQFFIGLRFHISQCAKLDLRTPIQNFCSFLNELRPNKSTMSLRCMFLNRKELLSLHAKQITSE